MLQESLMLLDLWQDVSSFDYYAILRLFPCSTEDMSFEFKKAFEKAVEKRALTFNQQWAMSDMAIFSSEAPVQLALYNVPPGKKFSIRQLQGTYGPFLIKSTHYEVYQENCWKNPLFRKIVLYK